MPNYSVRDIQTLEEFEITMKYSELEQYFIDNPNLQQIFTKFPGTIDPVVAGVRTIDNGFREVLSKASTSHYKSDVRIR